MGEMFYDYSKRDYLLPDGCKDLLDVLKLKQLEAGGDTAPSFEDFLSLCQLKPWVKHSAVTLPNQSIPEEIVVDEPITVRELAELLNQKPSQLVADLMSLNILTTLNHALDFETVSKIAAKYGCKVKRAI